MTDAAVLGIIGAALVAAQGLGTAWLTYTVKRNACGGDKCNRILSEHCQVQKGGENARTT